VPVAPICPTCRTPYRGAVAPGAALVCDSCMEEFDANGKKIASAPKAAPAPVPEPLPLPDEDEVPLAAPIEPIPAPPKARPVAKAVPAPAAKDTPAPAASKTNRVTGKPRTRRDDDEDEDEAPRRARRRPPSDGSRAVIIAMLCLGLVVVVGCIGAGVWFLVRTPDREQARTDRVNTPPTDARPNLNPQQPPGPFVPGGDPPLPPNPLVPPDGMGGPVRPGAPVPAFNEPANPFKAGTQTKLRETAAVALPALPPPAKRDPNSPFPPFAIEYQQIAYSPRHKLLFARTLVGVWVYDLATGKAIGTQAPKNGFSDMSLSPDQAALFVADYGGERTGYGDPIRPSLVHRFDLATRKWEDRKAPKIAWRIETVDLHRVLLLEQDQWVDVTLNKWETDGIGIRELARISSDYNGDIEYDPRTGRIYHGNRGISSPQITVRMVEGDKLKAVTDTGTYGTASEGGGGGTVVLSQDGSRLYYGALQVNAKEPRKNLEKFPDLIHAASRDIAFGSKAYYRATTGSKLGEYPFKILGGTGNPNDPFANTPPVIAVSPDGLSVWVIDRDKNTARQYALESAE
jgi:hypothetical protein